MAMHPTSVELAAYLDGALEEAARAEIRAHLLTCPACAARLERLRADARHIAAFSAAGPAPDVRAAVRARLRRNSRAGWLLRGGALAGAIAALFVFALLIGVSAGGIAVGRQPDRLFVTDRLAGQLLVLDAASGALLDRATLGPLPQEIRYDRQLGQLFVMLNGQIVAVDIQTLAIVNRWVVAQPFDTYAGMALDEQRGRLYIAEPSGDITVLDTTTLAPAGSFQLGSPPGDLALAPGGRTLYALDKEGVLWTIDTRSGAKSAQALGGEKWRRGWLVLSPDGQNLYLLRLGASALLQRIDTRSGAIGEPVALASGPAPQDLVMLANGRLAIARGDNRRGGVTILDAGTLDTIAQIDPETDEHHLLAGPADQLFGLNFTHGRVTRYASSDRAVVWRNVEPGWQPWDGAFIPGGWRWLR
jgi:DNA-binding beta-propeller fold protein YncE